MARNMDWNIASFAENKRISLFYINITDYQNIKPSNIGKYYVTRI